MTYHLPHPHTLTPLDFDTYSRAHSRISEAIEALSQCNLSFVDFCEGAPDAEAAFIAWSDAYAERLSVFAQLRDAQAYTAAWAKQALIPLGAPLP
jgi:hypothetical protein